jgi:hypothetical protein
MAYQVHLTTSTDGARADFRHFPGETPKQGEVIKIEENGNILKARVTRVLPRIGSQLLDHVEAIEIAYDGCKPDNLSGKAAG